MNYGRSVWAIKPRTRATMRLMATGSGNRTRDMSRHLASLLSDGQSSSLRVFAVFLALAAFAQETIASTIG